MSSSWQRRIERAEELERLHPFAAQILHFYGKIARFQGELYGSLENASGVHQPKPSGAEAGPPELPELLARFPDFLRLIEQNAPPQLQVVARELHGASEATRAELLNEVWSGSDATQTVGIHQFPTRAFLQPYAEFVRVRSGIKWEGYTHALCPFCSRKPGIGVLRQLGDGGSRSLICSFCLAEWQFRRIVCPNCAEENPDKLPVFTAGELPNVRVECCDTCKSYMKTIDLTKNGLAEPVVDEIAAIPLDLWAQERGYTKLQPNLLQM